MITLSNHERWQQISHPGHSVTQNAINPMLASLANRNVLNCALTEATARNLTEFILPAGLDFESCLSAAASGIVPESLRKWNYQPKIRAVGQLPAMKTLPAIYKSLNRLPWFTADSPTRHLAINARHVRYNYDLWQQLKPKTLRGVHTTLVLVMPQIGHALTPHIQLEKTFLYFASLARGLCAVQLFPAKYLFPDANLSGLADAPMPIFADLLPTTCGYAWPVVDHEPDPWRVLTRYEQSDRFYGYPFTKAANANSDLTLSNFQPGTMLLPSGKKVHARLNESTALATLDPYLNAILKLNRDAFEAATGLLRGTVTYDGLPFQLPVEMQSSVYAVILGQWRIELDRPGDLTGYTLKTKHAAIRGFDYFQRVEPQFSNFMRAMDALTADPDFCTYPLATHLTDSWLGGNVQVNHVTDSERSIGPTLMRSFYHQQLDYQMGMTNLMNLIKFRTRGVAGSIISRSGDEIESQLGAEGLAMHQLQKHFLHFDSHLFGRPTRPASLWPDHHSGWLQLDHHLRDVELPRL
jgi:hypothetical protein